MTLETLHYLEVVVGTVGFATACLLFSRSRPWRSVAGFLVFSVILMITLILSLILLTHHFDFISFIDEAIKTIIYTLVMLDGIVTAVGIGVIQYKATHKANELRGMKDDRI